MKYVGVLQNQNVIRYIKQDGSTKDGKCTVEARAQCTSLLKVNDLMKAEFDPTTFTITKVEKYVKSNKSNYNKPYNKFNSQDSVESLKRQIFATAGNIITQIKGIDSTNYEKALKDVYALGLELVLNKTNNVKPVEAKPKVAEVEETTLVEEEIVE